MAVLSKQDFLQVQSYNCKIIHPWHQNCLIGNLITSKSTVQGSSLFFGALYLLHYTPQFKQLTKKDLIPISKKFALSVSTAFAYMFLFTSGNCLFRKQLGQFSYYVVAYLVPIVCGTAIFLENPLRKKLISSSFASMFVEAIFRRIYISKIISRNIYFETILFMLCNALLMYEVKTQKSLMKGGQKEMWFYLPIESDECASKQRHTCKHDSCFLHGVKESLKYGSFGLALTLFKIIWYNIKFIYAPEELLRKIFMLKNLKLSSFVVTYIGIYRATTCYLCRKTGKDYELFGLFGGILAGISYCILPNFALLSSLVAVLLKIMGRQLKYKYNLPNLPYQELTFIITNAFLLNTRLFHGEACPTFFTKIINICSGGRANMIYNFIEETKLQTK